MVQRKRILVLWSTPSGYMDASMRALVNTGAADVFFVSQTPIASVAPIDLEKLGGAYQSVCFEKPTDYNKLCQALNEFEPDIILAGGSWRETAYRQILQDYRGKAARVFCSDAQWQGDLRQWAVAGSMRLARSKFYDRAFVAGERQFRYAERLGFKPTQIQSGLYSCDHESFSRAAANSGDGRFENPSFLFVGRLVDIKGISELLEGYSDYRQQMDNPWPLMICGTGPLEELVRESENVIYKGFVQPEELPGVMANHTTLLVPSHIEPWALVIHEAASAGMSVICSAACGAGDAYVENGNNGEVLTSVSSEAIAGALLRISKKEKSKLKAMSKQSAKLAATMTPSIWAKKVLAFAENK